MKTKKKNQAVAWSLWIPVVLAFVLIISAWTMLIQIAKDNPVQTIELKKQSP